MTLLLLLLLEETSEAEADSEVESVVGAETEADILQGELLVYD